ncbi:MAG TPA: Rieske 2Fe-2S domain-containing protein [Polyangia bacterium]|jgi:nitrite reductase/ring-hydroxylating ferredoxin subunit|nr:Rieske 2Fe-2S domain-containing protein [Polyangia bacterium]
MADDPRSAQPPTVDPLIDSPEREGLAGTARAGIYEPTVERDDVTIAPDGAPPEAQPRWRRDFPIDWPADQFVARRDFGRFLVLTSGAFVGGQAWIAAQHLIRKNEEAPPRVRIAALRDVPVGAAILFHYPTANDPCLLIRPDEQTLVAFSQTCTHLSCAVVPRIAEGLLHCPCHEGFFDLLTGRNVAGPPPRPLPKILLEIEGGDAYAIGVEERTV